MPKPAAADRCHDDERRRRAAAPPHGAGASTERRRLRRLAATLLLLLGGCASAPVVRWHSLLAPAADVPPAPVGNAVSAAAGVGVPAWLVELTVLRVPAAVEQPQWLVRLPDDTLRLLEEERWAAPLRDELRAALVQGLAARWNAVDAGGRPLAEATTDAIRDTLPQPGSPPPSANAPAVAPNRLARPAAAPPPPPPPNDATPPPLQPAAEPRRVTVDVTRFESLPDREAQLEASWTVRTLPGLAAARAGEPSAALLLACSSVFREPVGAGAPALAAGHRRAVAALADAIGRAVQAGRGAACPAAGANPGG